MTEKNYEEKIRRKKYMGLKYRGYNIFWKTKDLSGRRG